MDVVTLGAALNGSKTYTDNAVAALMGGVHYIGSVSYYNDLLSLTPEEGDAYTVKYSGTSGTDIDGGEYVWGYDEDLGSYAWISFSKNCYTKGETDTLLDAKFAEHFTFSENSGHYYLQPEQPQNPSDGDIWIG